MGDDPFGFLGGHCVGLHRDIQQPCRRLHGQAGLVKFEPQGQGTLVSFAGLVRLLLEQAGMTDIQLRPGFPGAVMDLAHQSIGLPGILQCLLRILLHTRDGTQVDEGVRFLINITDLTSHKQGMFMIEPCGWKVALHACDKPQIGQGDSLLRTVTDLAGNLVSPAVVRLGLGVVALHSTNRDSHIV